MRLAGLRSVLVAHALAIFAQSEFAGQFLSGIDHPVKFHEWTGWAILAVCALQVGIAATLLRTGQTSLWLLFGSVLLWLAEAIQVGTGSSTKAKVPEASSSSIRNAAMPRHYLGENDGDGWIVRNLQHCPSQVGILSQIWVAASSQNVTRP